MAIIVNQDLLYIGNFASFETDSLNGANGSGITVASASAALGRYDFQSGLRVVQDSTYDTGTGGTTAHENNVNGEQAAQITYELGGETVTSTLDTVFVVNVEIFNATGVSQGTTSMLVTRLVNGETFLAPTFASAPFFANPVTVGSVEVLTVTNVVASGDALPNPSINPELIICFTASTRIATPMGMVKAGDIVAGDRVMTADSGIQTVLWVGQRKLGKGQLAMNRAFAPVRISAGALGNGLPMRDLIVSQQHRMLVRSKIARRMFGTEEVLIAAKQLVELDGIDILYDTEEVTYVHFLCAHHEIVFAEGAPSECMYLGSETLKAVGADSRNEIFAIFPELKEAAPDALRDPARVLVKGRLGRKVAHRLAKNGRAAVDEPFAEVE